MLKKSLLAFSIIASLLLPTINVCAEDDTQEFITGATSGSMGVEVTILETYQVTIPAKITLQYDNQTGGYSGTYTIGVKANLLEGESVTVIPSTRDKLELRRPYIAPENVWATLSQQVDTWLPTPTNPNEIASDGNNYVMTTGTITIPRSAKPKSGAWQTTVGFTFTYNSLPIE